MTGAPAASRVFGSITTSAPGHRARGGGSGEPLDRVRARSRRRCAASLTAARSTPAGRACAEVLLADDRVERVADHGRARSSAAPSARPPRASPRSRPPPPARAPAERRVSADERARELRPRCAHRCLDQDVAGRALVVPLDLLRGRAPASRGIGWAQRSACVVPSSGISRPACAHAVAQVEWVWTIPPISRIARYNATCVGVSVDGRRSPSTTLPSRSTTHDVLRRHRVVGDAARLDRDEPRVAVNAARVAPRQRDQPVCGQRQIRRQHVLAQLIRAPVG